mmetsp:Transcript_10549/g.17594  ORF Transcript_10549/g.17594 Transcript_10549/m.17594 type:complete len:1518 (-) Transcript_10549:21-4574(-)
MVFGGSAIACLAHDNCSHHDEAFCTDPAVNHARPPRPVLRWNLPAAALGEHYLRSLSARRRVGHASSFYVDCGFFGAGGVATPHGAHEAVEHEREAMRLRQFEELHGATADQRLVNPPYEVLITPSNEFAMHLCLQDKKCIAMCRSELGSTTLHAGDLKMGFGDVDNTKKREMGPWVCVAKKGFEPPDSAGSTHMKDCWQDMYDATGGLWNDKKIIKFFAKGPGSMQLILDDSPYEKETAEETKMRCEQSQNCEAVCVHEKDPWRGILYGFFDEAKCTLGFPCDKLKKEAAEKALQMHEITQAEKEQLHRAMLDNAQTDMMKKAMAEGDQQNPSPEESAEREEEHEEHVVDEKVEAGKKLEPPEESALLETSSTGPLGKPKSKHWHQKVRAHRRWGPASTQATQRSMDQQMLPRAAIAASSFEQVPAVGIRLPTASTGLLFAPGMLPRPWQNLRSMRLDLAWWHGRDSSRQLQKLHKWKSPFHGSGAADSSKAIPELKAMKDLVPALMTASSLHKLEPTSFEGAAEGNAAAEGDAAVASAEGDKAVVGDAAAPGDGKAAEDVDFKEGEIGRNPADPERGKAALACPEDYEEITKEEICKQIATQQKAKFKVEKPEDQLFHPRGCYIVKHDNDSLVMFNPDLERRRGMPNRFDTPLCQRKEVLNKALDHVKDVTTVIGSAVAKVAVESNKWSPSFCPGRTNETEPLAVRKMQTGREGHWGQCVKCPDSNLKDKFGTRNNSKTGHPERLGDVMWKPDGIAGQAILKEYNCQDATDEFDCGCVDDDDDFRWVQPNDEDTTDPTGELKKEGVMIKDCSTRCKEYALQVAQDADPEEYKMMNLDDAVDLGYKILSPPSTGEEHGAAAENRAFFKEILIPAKKAKAWFEELYPEDNPSDLPHPGEDPLQRAMNPMGDPDPKADQPSNVKEPNDHDGWECYYLPKECRKKAQKLAEETMEKRKEEVAKEEADMAEFEHSLQINPEHLPQGFGEVGVGSEFWAKESAPAEYEMPNGHVVRHGGKAPARGSDISKWWDQCRALPSHLAKATTHAQIFEGHKWFDPSIDYCPVHDKTLIKEVSGRWLECCGGLDADASENVTRGTVVEDPPPSSENDENNYEEGLRYRVGEEPKCNGSKFHHITEMERCRSAAGKMGMEFEVADLDSEYVTKGCYVKRADLDKEGKEVPTVVFQEKSEAPFPSVHQLCANAQGETKLGQPTPPFDCPAGFGPASPDVFEKAMKELKIPLKEGNQGIIYPQGCFLVGDKPIDFSQGHNSALVTHAFCNAGKIPNPEITPVCAKELPSAYEKFMARPVHPGGEPLLSTPRCRALHEEPVANCELCPDMDHIPNPDEYKCLARGWNGIPPGEFSAMRSMLSPAEPRGMPANEQQLEVARKIAKPKAIAARNGSPADSPGAPPALPGLNHRQGPPDLRCFHVGQTGQLGSQDAARVLYAAAEVPPAALLCAALAPQRPASGTAGRQKLGRRSSRRIGGHESRDRCKFRKDAPGGQRVLRILNGRWRATCFL